MTVALLFSGDSPGWQSMALTWSEHSRNVRMRLQRAGMIAHTELIWALERGDRALLRPEVRQPALTALAVGIFQDLQEAGVTFEYVAGHSLGEIAAWCASGAISPDTALEIARTRGRLLSRAADKTPGGMLAVTSERAVAEGQQLGLELAAHNAPDEWVLAGAESQLSAIAKVHGGTPLEAAGPWHTRAMGDAVDPLYRMLRTQLTRPMEAMLVCNVTGTIAAAGEIPELLSRQLAEPVQWAKTMRTLFVHQNQILVTIGPGDAVRSQAHRCLGSLVTVLPTDTPDDLQRTAETLAK